MIRAIHTTGFLPFDKLKIAFENVKDRPSDLAEVHLFTGVNGTGKTRILSLISALLGQPAHLIKRMKGMAPASFMFTDEQGIVASAGGWSSLNFQNDSFSRSGSHDSLTRLSRIPAFAYSANAYLSDSPVKAMGDVRPLDRAACLSFHRPEDSSGALLQVITNLLLEAAMDSINGEQQGRAIKLVNSLESSIGHVTGKKFKFKADKPPNLKLSVLWGDAKLSFDLLPDGLRSILGWMVHAVVMIDLSVKNDNPLNSEVIFLLDEIESHLHPAWQRRILPAFQRLFPKAQIFIATHSPFVIASLNYGWIHLLKSNAGNVKIESVSASKGDSYISVVEDIMGIKEWYDQETEDLLAQFRCARDAAYQGNKQEEDNARRIAGEISQRSSELEFLVGKELMQMERQMASPKNTQ